MTVKRLLVSDIDGTLLDNGEVSRGLSTLRSLIRKHRDEVALVYATGRSYDDTMALISSDLLPTPDAIAPSIGTEIWFSDAKQADPTFRNLIDIHWHRQIVEETAKRIPGLVLQAEEMQTPFKVSFEVYRPRKVIDLSTLLKNKGQDVRIIYSCGKYLDVLPANAGKRAAVSYLSQLMDVPERHVLTCGDSGNDLDMLTNPATANVLVANAEAEMAAISRSRFVYFADRTHAAGVVEGAEAFGFWPR